MVCGLPALYISRLNGSFVEGLLSSIKMGGGEGGLQKEDAAKCTKQTELFYVGNNDMTAASISIY